MTFVKNTSPVKTIQDAFKREVILGASGRSSTVFVYPAVLGNVIGAKFKLVLGYASSPEAMLAMERGEVEGHSTSLEVVRALHPTWLSEKKITVLVQYALRRHPELPDVPMSWELGRNPEEQQILKVVANATEVGKMILAPPGMPADRVHGAAAGVRRHDEGPGFHRGTEGEPGRAWPDGRRRVAEARGRPRRHAAGDDRQDQGVYPLN